MGGAGDGSVRSYPVPFCPHCETEPTGTGEFFDNGRVELNIR